MTTEEIKEIAKSSKWGFLRETNELAIKAGIDKDTGLFRTGLSKYLEEIFPEVNDWIHDNVIPNSKRKFRPDYRSKTLKMIIEFDGLPHYTQPDVIKKDDESNKFYESLGYKVVRIPYFIQLSKSAVKTLFGVELDHELFDERIPSLGVKGKNTPAYLCGAGVMRMAKEFKKFPKQYLANLRFLEDANDEYLSGAKLLKTLYESLG